MAKRTLLIVDNNVDYIHKVKSKLESEKLQDEYEYVEVTPMTAEPDFVARTVVSVCEKVARLDVAAVLVDMVVDEDAQPLDSSGVEIALEVKHRHPSLPVYLITAKIAQRDYQNVFSEATMTGIDGALAKSYLLYQFDRRRLERLTAPRAVSPASPAAAPPGYDVCVLTALFSAEFENVLPTLSDRRDTRVAGLPAQEGVILDNRSQARRVVAACAPYMGLVDASVLSTAMIIECRPRYLVLTGVCGGRKAKGVSVGDVVIPERATAYQYGKFTDDGFRPRTVTESIDPLLLQKMVGRQGDIANAIMQEDTSRDYRTRPIRVHNGCMASGLSVVDRDGMMEREIAEHDDSVTAIDMEAYAVLRASRLLGTQGTAAFVVKGVMDISQGKTDDAKPFAAYAGARFLLHLIRDVLFA